MNEPPQAVGGSAVRSNFWPGAVCSGVLFLLALSPFPWVLREPLSAVDAIPTIEAARVESLSELPSVLLRELRGGAQQDGFYWRPLTLVTYTIDHALWGWRPLGYHLTDLVLGGLAAVAVFWMVRFAFGRGAAFAAVVAAGFALHPAAVEVLPAVSRRQEPLLVIGVALSLIGAAQLPARRALMLHLLGVVIAVTSVERGLVAPALVGVYLLLFRWTQADLGTRLVRAALWTLPSLGIAATFFALRTALFGAGGVAFAPSNLVTIPLNIALWILYPQQFVDLSAPTTALGWAGIGVLAAALAVGGLVALRSSRDLPLLAFGALWIAIYTLLFSVAGQGHPWYVYTAVPAQMLAATGLAWEGTRIWRERRAGALAAASLLLAAGIAVPSLAASPLIASYSAWGTVNGLSERFLEALDRAARSQPPNATFVLFNLPSSVRESDGDRGVTRSAAGLWPRSVRVWASVREHPQRVIALGASDHVGSPGVPEVELAEGALAVFFPPGPSTYGNPDGDAVVLRSVDPARGQGLVFAWPPAGVRVEGPIIPLLFDGRDFVPAFRRERP